MSWLRLITLMLALAYSWTSRSQPLLAVSEEWAGYTENNGSGVYWHTLDAVLQKMGLSAKKRTVPWARAEREVRAGQADIIVGAYYEKSDELFFPQWHLSVEENIVAVTSHTTPRNWRTRNRDLTFSWIRGYGFEQHSENTVRFLEVNSVLQGLRLVNAGRVTALLDYASTLNKHEASIKQVFPNFSQRFILEEFRKGRRIYIGFSARKIDQAFVLAFDEMMSKAVQDGTIRKIYARWHKDYAHFGESRFGPPK